MTPATTADGSRTVPRGLRARDDDVRSTGRRILCSLEGNRSGRACAGAMYSVVGTLMLKPAPPRRSPALARTASATGGAGAASLPSCADSPPFSRLRPRNAFDGTARVERSRRRAGHLVQRIARGSRRRDPTKVSSSTGSIKN